jgi:hypothetical protein
MMPHGSSSLLHASGPRAYFARGPGFFWLAIAVDVPLNCRDETLALQ